jgi:hypothetical protein
VLALFVIPGTMWHAICAGQGERRDELSRFYQWLVYICQRFLASSQGDMCDVSFVRVIVPH